MVLQLAEGRARLTPAQPGSHARAHSVALPNPFLCLSKLSSHGPQEDKIAR